MRTQDADDRASDGGHSAFDAGAAPSARSVASVEIDALFHTYDRVDVVRGLSLRVEPGEIVCLLGSSGCGKTTLLRLLAGIERPYAGTIKLDGRTVASSQDFVVPEKRGVGLMFQDFALFPHLTVLDNVRFGLKTLPRAEQEERAVHTLDQLGLKPTAKDFPHMLSGGMQQRVALARALVPQPRLMLMDEPFSGLDRRTRDAVRDETLAVLRDLGTTSIVVTHDPDEALRIADRIILMREGRIVQDGKARDYFDDPVDLFAARFFHELNEFEGVVDQGRVETPVGNAGASGLADGTAVRIGIRHNGIDVHPGDAGTGQVSAQVKIVRFLGDSDLLHLEVDGYDRPVFARTKAIGLFVEGAHVALSVHPNAALIFQNHGAATT